MIKKNSKLVLALILVGVIFSIGANYPKLTFSMVAENDPPPPEPNNPYFYTEQAGSQNGEAITKNIIGGPPNPPAGYAFERNATSLPVPNKEAGVNVISDVPVFDWSYGCSPTSAAMIAGYHDRTYFANMYAGPTNESVMPLNNSAWGSGETPLSATHLGLDGRVVKGHVDDYWIAYGNSDDDPFYGNWAQHSYGECLGDYMKTNQTSIYGNTDGETTFYTWETDPEPLTCSQMATYNIHQLDGTYGVKLFYQSRGYTVSDCYSQRTDVPGGFNFEDYKVEIDAGYPVMFHVEGHTMVGVGYDDAGQTMYIHDTWDYNTHTLTWGGSYAGMDMYAVSVVHPNKLILMRNTYNDTYQGLTYSTGWQELSESGYYHDDIHYSTSPGSYVNFIFNAAKIKVIYTGGPDQGIINVYIDGNLEGTIDQYNSSTSYQSVWTSGEFPTGEHDVRLEHASGGRVDIDAIEILAGCYPLTLSHTGEGSDPVASPTKSQKCETEGEYNSGEVISLSATPAENWMVGSWAGTNNDSDAYDTLTNILTMPSGEHSVLANYIVPPGIGTYEDTDSRIKYEGGWVVFPDNNLSGGTSHITDDGRYPSASFSFTGTRVSLIYTQSLQRSRMNISIDGNYITTLTQYGEPTIYQNRWDSPILEEGGHKVVFSHDIYWTDGGRYSDIDAIVISNPEAIPPAPVNLSLATGNNFYEVDLNWIAPGEDGNNGTATEYIIRHAFGAIDTEAKWEAATDVVGVPIPQVAGTPQSMIVSHLAAGQVYYFAIRAVDEVGNISALANSPSAVAKTPEPVGLGVYENEDPEIYFTGNWEIWNDSRTSGGSTRYTTDNSATAALYFVGNQVSLVYTEYTNRDKIAASIDGGEPFMISQLGAFEGLLNFQQQWSSPVLSEAPHTIQLWHPGGDHYIEVDALVVSHAEFDPPAAVTLNASTGSNNGEIDLNWIAPGDDGNTGTATEYIVRYADSEIDTYAKWQAASDVSGEPIPQEAGTAQSMTISGFYPGDSFYFALVSKDDRNNISELSNSPMGIARAPEPVGEGIYENDYPSIIYTGTWTTENIDIASGGNISKTNDSTATAALTFVGRQVVFNFIRDVDFGYFYIYLDGNSYYLSQSNIYYTSGSTTTIIDRWVSPVLEYGTHTIKIVYSAGGDFNNIDAFTVIDTPDIEAPAIIELSAATSSNFGQIDLDWIAPGDDGNIGTATEYIVLCSETPIDSEDDWDTDLAVLDPPIPEIAGTHQSMTVSGLLPGVRYYFAIRALDEWDHISDLSNSPSAETLFPTPVESGTYENDDPNIVYSGNWSIWETPGASGGSTRYSDDKNATATLVFSGTRIELVYTSNPTRGWVGVKIPPNSSSITFSQSSTNLVYQQHYTFDFTPGTHTIQLYKLSDSGYIDLDAFIVTNPDINPPGGPQNFVALPGNSPGEIDLSWEASGDDGNIGTATEYVIRYSTQPFANLACWEAATDVIGEPAPLEAGTPQSMTISGLIPGDTYYFAMMVIDDVGLDSTWWNKTDPVIATFPPIAVPSTYENESINIIYHGNWTTWDTLDASGGSTRYSNDPAAEAKITFTGRQASLLFTRFTTRGNIEITIDDGTPITLNQYGSNLSFQNRWDSPFMDFGTHTIVLRHPDGSHYIDLDAIVISDPETDPPAAVTLFAAAGTNVGEVDLSWTAPGDDNNTGTASEYVIRYALNEIATELDWNAAKNVIGEPQPQIAGTPQSMTVSNLPPGPMLFFAIRTQDDSGNISDISNSPSTQAKYLPPVSSGTYQNGDPNITQIGTWSTLNNDRYLGGTAMESNDPNSKAILTFTGDHIHFRFTFGSIYGNIQISIDGESPIIISQYNSRTYFASYYGISIPDDGQPHSLEISHPGGSHYINLDAIEIIDPEEIPPAAVSLSAVTGNNNGEVDLDWIAPGDDGNTGTAINYIIRYANNIIDSQDAWNAATDIEGEPMPEIAGTAQSMTISGLNPGQVYYFAMRTEDEFQNISDLSNSPSAAAKAPVPVSPGTYQNGDSNIAYTGNWTNWNTASASGGSTQYSNDPAASATLVFSGRQISLLFTRYTTRGNIEITIDGGTPVLLNQYGSTLTYQNRWDSPLMDAGTHTVVLRHPGGTKYIDLDAIIISDPETIPPAAVTLAAAAGSSNGQVDLNWTAPGDDDMTGTATSYIVRYAAAAIDTQAKWDAATDVTGEPTPLVAGTAQSMVVSGLTPGQTYFFALRTLDDSNNLSDLSNSPSAAAKSPTPVDPGTYQNDDPNIAYTGNWTTWNDSRASGSSTRYSNDPAATATLTFTGRQVSLLFTRYTSRGNIAIAIDGGTPVLLNQYGSTLTFKNRWDSPLMDSGTHTVKFSHPGGTKYVDLDAIIISDPETIPPAAVTLAAATGTNNGQVDLDWIAPGDDGDTGTATSYIVRYAAAAIDSQAKWDAATDVTGEPTPLVAGSAQSMTVSGLVPGQTYFFALRTLDDSNNLSDLSNSPSAAAKSPTPVDPGTYQNDNLNIIYTGTWTNWNEARASGSSTRYSNDPAATATLTFTGRQVSLLFTRYTSRGNIAITIDGGTPVLLNQYGSTLTFQNRWDSPLMTAGTHIVEVSHPGGTKYIDLDAIIISDPESIPPAAVTLSAATGSSNGQVDLDWIAPGDDGDTGTATSYIVRYAAAAIDSQAKWDAATDVTGEPTPLVAGTDQFMTVSGLVPGQTYFFALRTLDDSNNLSDLSNSPSAAAMTPTPVGVGTYQENDPNIFTTGSWTPWSIASASGGSTMYANDPTASASLTFTGRQVSLLYTRYTSRGNIEITIDGGTPVLLNQYGAALTFQNRWDSPLMTAGTHTVVLRHPGGTKYIDLDALIVSDPESIPPAAVTLSAVTGSSTGQVTLDWNSPGDDGDMVGTALSYTVRYAAAAIDSQAKWDAATDVTGEPTPKLAGTHQSMTISGLTPGQTYFFALRTLDDSGNLSDLSNSPSAVAYTPPPVGAGIYQEDDGNIAYTGTWTSWSHASASGGSIRYSNQADASATLTFTGRQVSLIFTRYTSRGEIEITIDDGAPVLFNQYGATLSFQNRWDSPALDAGTHTIRLRHPGGTKYIDIDAIEVRAEPQ